MAVEYAKVLAAQAVSFITIGRGEKSSEEFSRLTGLPVITGGLERFLATNPELPASVIIAVGPESLASTCITLLRNGISHILLEKPGGISAREIIDVSDEAKANEAEVFLAYNRRFYSSVIKAREIIKADGGVSSFHFEFTEWPHVIRSLTKADGVKEKWFLGNSTHVVDLAFYLGGLPVRMTSFTKGSLDWHPASSCFTGAGMTDRGALFSYHANWNSPGRWALEILTDFHRLYFKPLELLQIQQTGSLKIEDAEIDNALDKEYKPGLYRQVQSFLNGEKEQFIDIHTQALLLPYYCKIANYKSGIRRVQH